MHVNQTNMICGVDGTPLTQQIGANHYRTHVIGKGMSYVRPKTGQTLMHVISRCGMIENSREIVNNQSWDNEEEYYNPNFRTLAELLIRTVW